MEEREPLIRKTANKKTSVFQTQTGPFICTIVGVSVDFALQEKKGEVMHTANKPSALHTTPPLFEK